MINNVNSNKQNNSYTENCQSNSNRIPNNNLSMFESKHYSSTYISRDSSLDSNKQSLIKHSVSQYIPMDNNANNIYQRNNESIDQLNS